MNYVNVNGAVLAWREIGAERGTVPLVMLQRFRGTMDHWDPELLDALAAHRRVIVFDSAGIGRSTGTTPDTVEGMARVAGGFLDAIGVAQADVLGWSLGGAVAQQLALDRPDLVRRVIVAGSGPIGSTSAITPEVRAVAARPVNDDEDFLFLFFKDTESSRAAGRAHLARLARIADFSPPVAPASIESQRAAVRSWTAEDQSALARLEAIRQPVLVANGDADRMIPTRDSFVLSQAVPHAKLIVYPDSGHGFLFQHPREFACDVARFLAA